MKKLFTLALVAFWILAAHPLQAKQNIPWNTKIQPFSCPVKGDTLKNFKGKVLLVNFFATYCAPCQVELLEFGDLYRKYNAKGFEIITFMVDRGGEVILPHIINSKRIHYCVAIADENILNVFNWPDILPTTFLIDKNGNIVKKFVGYAGKKELEKEIENLLNN
ncbi:Redoxin domain protein [Thermodesulfatator indicus DSM 15286]|uniref:Redoxin domain protein n=1 Tax=Thermodesulfatator indicus (strain DSM 15286 / JCM 11887 / CIR29812) TaxID=667014 RepID=F8AA23_THEID|nr:TlpA disulfide reductase family protein [Thermodesulfatator indicus]AEH45309.1 Redoxin domain protein [Thermodesulfatator indicus DSM 15286]